MITVLYSISSITKGHRLSAECVIYILVRAYTYARNKQNTE